MSTEHVVHVLNLGAGVQSTAAYLMFMEGLVKGADGEPVKLGAAVFGDTQEEGQATYRHLEWMHTLGGPPILVRTAGKLGDDLVLGKNLTGGRFASIPAFLKHPDGTQGLVRRQCTAEYKIEVVQKTIRRDILGIAPRKRLPKDVRIVQYFGLSFEEMRRVFRVQKRFADQKQHTCRFTLVEAGMTRAGCREWMTGRVPHEVPRSACVFCPYHSNEEWRRIRDEDPEGWARAVQVDKAIRSPTSVCSAKLRAEQYIHRQMVPLDQADLEDAVKGGTGLEIPAGVTESACEGMCGV